MVVPLNIDQSPTFCTVRAWYATGSRYVYWNVKRINSLILDYPSSSPGYPTYSDLSDFTLLNYEGQRKSDNDIDLWWAVGMEDGYVTYSNSSTADYADANYAAKSLVIGIASEPGYVRKAGLYMVWCDNTASRGDPLRLSINNVGMATSMNGINNALADSTYLVNLGICLSNKIDPAPGLVYIAINIESPIEVQLAPI